MESVDNENVDVAYVAGRIFAVLESIQYFAMGGNVNAGIRERFFTFASTNPAPAFGRLVNMTQHHISKLKAEKAGLAVNLDKDLQALFSKITAFPSFFSLEEQGQFAVGYYHQKEEQMKKKDIKEGEEKTDE